MASEKKRGTVQIVTEIAQPVAEELGVELWDVRYEKEGSSWYLRIFIDKEGGVNIDDCEAFSRTVDKLIDERDPIAGSYYLEVSSPGIERELIKPRHFERYLGHPVAVRLIRPVDGVRDFVGTLCGYEDGQVTIELEQDIQMSFEKKEAAFVRLYEDYEAGGAREE